MFCPSMLYHFSFILIIFAGTPPTIALSGTSFTTTAFGATVTLLPILIFPITLHPTASSTLSPMDLQFTITPPLSEVYINHAQQH